MKKGPESSVESFTLDLLRKRLEVASPRSATCSAVRLGLTLGSRRERAGRRLAWGAASSRGGAVLGGLWIHQGP